MALEPRALAKALRLSQLSRLRLVFQEVVLEAAEFPAKAPRPSQSLHPHPAFLGAVLEVDLALRDLAKARQLSQLSHLRLVFQEVVLEAAEFPAKAPRPSQSLHPHPAFLGAVLEVDLALRVLAKARQLSQLPRPRLVLLEVVLGVVKVLALHPHQVLQEAALEEVVKEVVRALGLSQ